MEYARLAGFFERLEATSGRLEMTGILVEMLQAVPKKDVVAVVRLLQGAVAPDWEGLETGVAEKQILKSLATATGGAVDRMQALYLEKGDLGLVAEAVLAPGAAKQKSLFGARELSVQDVFGTLVEIARTQGIGSQEGKQRLLSKMLLEASPIEARYITRAAAGRLRLGVADMSLLDAMAAWHLGRGVRSVTAMEDAERAEQAALRATLEHAYDLCSDLAVVAAALASGGVDAVRAIRIEPGVPVRPMAAERLKTLPEILEKMEGRVLMEYKYDGLRIQAHVPHQGPVRLFSRRLEDFTNQFPDVGKALAAIPALRGAIVEGEAVALDEAGRLRPFQDISRRRGRKADLAAVAAEIPVTLFLFDLLAQGGKPMMELPQAERRARLERLVPADGPVRPSTMAEATTAEGMADFFDQAVADGAEGIMCKDPRASYKAGSRGFAWIKFKTDYTEALVDTLDLVAIGAFVGRGRRAGWYGALLMAAYDPERGVWPGVCKLGTGFDDATLMGLKEKFAAHAAPACPPRVESGLVPDVWLEPAVVMEVQAAELTLSPTHRAGWGMVKPDAGFAARFPRFTGRWRDDKSAEQATTVAELLKMYQLRHARAH
ncbi:MAG: ligase 1 [Thermoplasmata archaeon]|nr:ligase 1 [Thermoplasmata archaeon]